jgi:DNA transformation protein and related proteins
MNPQTPLTQGKNFGPKSRVWLEAIGITSLEQIEQVGVVEVYLRLKAQFPQQVSLNMLYALQAALLNIHWNALPPEMKAELRAQVDSAGRRG